MKSFVLFLLFFLIAAPVKEAQTKKETTAINKLMKSYYDVHIRESWPDLVEFLYPKVFVVYTKESLKAELAKPRPENEMSVTRHDSLWTETIGKPFKHNKVTYFLVTFKTALSINSLRKTPDGKCDQGMLTMIFGAYQKQYGEQNIVMVKNECKLKALNTNEVIVVNDPKVKKLTLIEKKPETASLLKKVLPAEVYNHYFPADTGTK
ncbi:MAG: hypothetical protein FMNOHCHN_03938 [Ignavibacteriaceae bacterium]|nr:hypothetical protein [Ignavibacteriaceae bacterium]